MEHRTKHLRPIINPAHYGVSFSIKQCRNFGLDPHETLEWLIAMGWRRFRLMSYWNEHEKQPGVYDFAELDWQIDLIAAYGGEVSLCLGVKQPRWPEYHWPQWAWQSTKPERDAALLRYIEVVVRRYKSHSAIVSYQLENEALLRGFGERIDIDRGRLRQEFQLVEQLDPNRPICMSTSNGWGIPLRRPQPDIVGLSYYGSMYKNGSYHKTIQRPWLHRLRSRYIPQPVFIHELQAEPWGPQAIWEMSTKQQDESMSTQQIAATMAQARLIAAYPIDLWGAEWWYWRSRQSDDAIIGAVLTGISDSEMA